MKVTEKKSGHPAWAKTFHLSCVFLVATLVFFLVASPYLAAHDVQRVGQIAIALIVLGPVIANRDNISVQGNVRFFLLIVLLLGSLSCLLSAQPMWAFAEVSLFILILVVAQFFAITRRVYGVRADYFFCAFVIALCAVKAVQFISSTVAAFMSGSAYLDLDLLVVGFSNKRFYGQFQTLTLPLLALPLLLASVKTSIKRWSFVVFSCWWMIAICGGTRGTWLGMGCAAIVMFCFCGRWGRRWTYWQMAAAVVGVLLFWVFFSLLPNYLSMEILNFAGDRLNTSLSARDVIWRQAWEMIQAQPLLGLGPMHFADIPNPVAAHPHQAILQWASEWGVPSTLLVMGLIGYGIRATIRLIKRKASSDNVADVLRVCLFASLMGALVQSMVDGVIVMPYSQLWLAIVAGWLVGLHEWSVRPAPPGALLRLGWSLSMILAVGLLLLVAVRDFPDMNKRNEQYVDDFHSYLKPRFWQQGVIATHPQ